MEGEKGYTRLTLPMASSCDERENNKNKNNKSLAKVSAHKIGNVSILKINNKKDSKEVKLGRWIYVFNNKWTGMTLATSSSLH